MKKAFWVLFPLVIIYISAVYWYKNPSTNLTFDFNELEKIPLKVDKNFLWGSATSSYQVEGNCTNSNWNLFENSVDEKGKPRIFENQKSGKASDQWNRYAEDILLMKKLGLNAYRFSVEWSKIEPEEGKFDEKVLDHYEKLVDELLASKIEPTITLHHFTNPIWFEQRGAFLWENSPKIFARYAAKVYQRLGKKIKLWCTINEPTVYAFNGYFFGEFPPGKKDMKKGCSRF